MGMTNDQEQGQAKELRQVQTQAADSGLTAETKSNDLARMRAALADKKGKIYWRTLEEVSDTPEFNRWFDDEFPNRSSIMDIDRRSLLKFMGASLALAGLSGCRGVFLPEDKVVPYVKAPEELVPGKSLYYASSTLLAGYATGVLVEQHEGRPIKYEGNPGHPSSLGALDVFSQAEILNLYDPDRAQNVLQQGEISTWDLFFKEAEKAMTAQKALKGEGIRILTGAVTSPSFAWAIRKLLRKYPQARVHTYEPAGRAHVHAGMAMVGFNGLTPLYDFTKAKVVVSFDSDFLHPASGPGSLRYARDFSDTRRVIGAKGSMSRLYAVESSVGLVGAMADHRYPVAPSQVYAAALVLAQKLGIQGIPSATIEGAFAAEVDEIVKDLMANARQSIIIAGDQQPAEVHAVVALINERLQNVGATVSYIPNPEFTFNAPGIDELVLDMAADKVDALLIFGGNPVYDAPVDLKFEENLAKVGFSVYHGLYVNETANRTKWSLPATHTLEEWGDAKAHDGTPTIVQPLIAPLYDGRSALEVLFHLADKPRAGYDIVRDYWKAVGLGQADFEKAWRRFVHDGVFAAKIEKGAPKAGLNATLPEAKKLNGIEIAFLPDPSIYDGRFANNGWLQELPKPLTKLVWDNVILMSPKRAQELNLWTDARATVKTDAGEVLGTVFAIPGHPSDSVTLYLGYGRTAGGTIATITGDEGGGFNAYALRTSKGLTYSQGAVITPAGGEGHLASTQGHSPLGGNRIPDDRDIIRAGTLAGFLESGMAALQSGHSMDQEEIKKNNLFPEEIFEWNGAQWGMTIDMNVCSGCNACVTACQAENNISVVGKEQVSKGREMHWIRIDRYYSGDDENPELVWQPVACVHCEKAPCEPVCPVAATVHSHEGLNQMVYNRCVGTRYCSNNCPYKVRRFNYLNFSDNQKQFSNQVQPWKTRLIPGPINSPKDQGIQLLKMLNNPDVTVRGRGVMEKCTYCVQRINEARIEAKKVNKELKDGDVVTACQQACPTQAIVFGNIADPESQVSKLRKDPRSYLLLEELQTRPRTSHLAKLRNPNPALQKVATQSAEKH